MEGTYACNLNNRFELFLDEENDPLELLAKSEQDKRKATDKKDSKKDAKKKGLSKSLMESVKTIAAAVDSTGPKPLAGRNNIGGRSTSPTQGNRPPRRDNLERRNNEKNFEPRPEGDRPPRENRGPRGDGPRGPRRDQEPGAPRTFRDGGNRNFRGGDREGGRPGGRGREFDRRSGDNRSGVKSVEKRGGQGSFNWGDPTEVEGEQVDATPQEPREANVEAGEEAAVPAEPEQVVMTLDQWKKEQAAKQSRSEYTSIRKPNEGVKEDPKIKKALVLKKKKADDSDDVEGDAEESEDECENLKKQLEQTLASQFHFADLPKSKKGAGTWKEGGKREPREPRDGGAQERRPPASRGPRQNQHTPRVEDLNDFPSLAA